MTEILSIIEQNFANKLLNLKQEAGSHSPSIFTLLESIPELKIKVDACFLSNPYATDLFINYFKKELVDSNKIRDVLEFYPSQNQVIADILANHLNISSNNIFIGNGAIEIIQAVVHNFTKSKILINIPTFSSYYEFAKPDVKIVYNTLSKEKNFQFVLEDYLNIVEKEKPDTVVLINPNNPDGNYIHSKHVELLLDNLKEVETVIIDESFIHFAFENSDYDLISFASLVSKYKNLVILKSMSKDFGIAGIRAGYAIMSESRVKSLLKNGYLWNSNGLSEYFFRLYVRKDFLNEYELVRKKYIIESQEFFAELSQIKKIKVYPSKANFALIELPYNINSDDFVINLLIKYGVYTRTCSDKIGLEGNFIRLASRTKGENVTIIDSLKNLILQYETAGII
jgi:histidinol-phosphate/aromatic aminotransferase/cobyric acid decarboxylase-like protein